MTDKGSMPRTSIRVIVESTKATVGYGCAVCGVLHGTNIYACSEDEAQKAAVTAAEKCCAPRSCNDCGGAVERKYWTKCDTCRATQSQEHERERYEAATRVPAAEYDGEMVCIGEDDFRYTTDVDEGEGEPPWAWATTPRRMRLAADDILDGALDEYHEDARDEISTKDLGRLQRYLDAWCAHVNVVSYYTDHSRVVVFCEN